MGKITPFLWYDTEAEEAATLYTSLFPNSTILTVNRYGAAGPGPEGSVMTVSFELDGQRFVALNGGPAYTFTEAVSFVVDCKTQEEVDTVLERADRRRGGEHVRLAAGTGSASRGRSSRLACPSC